jgi:phosphoribosylanthranilate isomerase
MTFAPTDNSSMNAGRIRVKFCGITRAQDAVDAAALGADAIGLVFYANSPRALTPAQAAEIAAVLPPFVSTVALFVNPAAVEVQAVINAIDPTLLQFHGDETPAQCEVYRRPYIKAIRMGAGVDLRDEANRYRRARALLLDAFEDGRYGGTGQVFDWLRIPSDVEMPFILAGGLTPDNVAAAIAAVRPYAVDVSGGIEASKGIKDPAKMRAFLQEVNRGCH